MLFGSQHLGNFTDYTLPTFRTRVQDSNEGMSVCPIGQSSGKIPLIQQIAFETSMLCGRVRSLWNYSKFKLKCTVTIHVAGVHKGDALLLQVRFHKAGDFQTQLQSDTSMNKGSCISFDLPPNFPPFEPREAV